MGLQSQKRLNISIPKAYSNNVTQLTKSNLINTNSSLKPILNVDKTIKSKQSSKNNIISNLNTISNNINTNNVKNFNTTIDNNNTNNINYNTLNASSSFLKDSYLCSKRKQVMRKQKSVTTTCLPNIPNFNPPSFKKFSMMDSKLKELAQAVDHLRTFHQEFPQYQFINILKNNNVKKTIKSIFKRKFHINPSREASFIDKIVNKASSMSAVKEHRMNLRKQFSKMTFNQRVYFSNFNEERDKYLKRKFEDDKKIRKIMKDTINKRLRNVSDDDRNAVNNVSYGFNKRNNQVQSNASSHYNSKLNSNLDVRNTSNKIFNKTETTGISNKKKIVHWSVSKNNDKTNNANTNTKIAIIPIINKRNIVGVSVDNKNKNIRLSDKEIKDVKTQLEEFDSTKELINFNETFNNLNNNIYNNTYNTYNSTNTNNTNKLNIHDYESTHRNNNSNNNNIKVINNPYLITKVNECTSDKKNNFSKKRNSIVGSNINIKYKYTDYLKKKFIKENSDILVKTKPEKKKEGRLKTWSKYINTTDDINVSKILKFSTSELPKYNNSIITNNNNKANLNDFSVKLKKSNIRNKNDGFFLTLGDINEFVNKNYEEEEFITDSFNNLEKISNKESSNIESKSNKRNSFLNTLTNHAYKTSSETKYKTIESLSNNVSSNNKSNQKKVSIYSNTNNIISDSINNNILSKRLKPIKETKEVSNKNSQRSLKNKAYTINNRFNNEKILIQKQESNQSSSIESEFKDAIDHSATNNLLVNNISKASSMLNVVNKKSNRSNYTNKTNKTNETKETIKSKKSKQSEENIEQNNNNSQNKSKSRLYNLHDSKKFNSKPDYSNLLNFSVIKNNKNNYNTSYRQTFNNTNNNNIFNKSTYNNTYLNTHTTNITNNEVNKNNIIPEILDTNKQFINGLITLETEGKQINTYLNKRKTKQKIHDRIKEDMMYLDKFSKSNIGVFIYGKHSNRGSFMDNNKKFQDSDIIKLMKNESVYEQSQFFRKRFKMSKQNERNENYEKTQVQLKIHEKVNDLLDKMILKNGNLNIY